MTEKRYCPICEVWMDETVCPTDGVGTITEQALSAVRDTLSEGLVLASRYRIEELIGRGGMGRVYRAEQTSIGRFVALKTLNPDFRADAKMLKRFHREARAAATLEHPNIVKIHDFESNSSVFAGGSPTGVHSIRSCIRMDPALKRRHARLWRVSRKRLLRHMKKG